MISYMEALGIARLLLSTGMSIEEAVSNPAVPEEFKKDIKSKLEEEKTITLRPATMIVDDSDHVDWLNEQDRSNWTYWLALRQFLLSHKNWSMSSVRSIDKETDRILSRLSSPNAKAFDKRGLVLGYVQSGKTSNYTALIAKAADSGYRLVIVLAGMDKGLRLQTQRRLKCELVGGKDSKSVPIPPIGKQWFEFTKDDLEGDFQPGYATPAALQGPQPVLLVIKKNGHVLRRLMRWLDSAPPEIMSTIPLLVIDDEADSASVDTRGSYQQEEQPLPDDYEEPSVINGLIRDLLNKFQKRAYVAYTATPFANMLIPFDNYDPKVQNDLYPRNFIVDLPKPAGYVGAEDLFGRMDDITEDSVDGYDVIRNIPDSAVLEIQELRMPEVLKKAILSFVLAGAARAQRKGDDEFPATMLIHTNYRIANQLVTTHSVSNWFTEIKDDWRYDPKSGIKDYLKNLWNMDFLPILQDNNPEQAVAFEEILPFIGKFFESIKIRTINSATGEVLDYEKEPHLKTIAIGGNKLSRGLTLEGLLISFYLRRTIMYDTLMQMGRWFGFRRDYVDLTRIYTTSELAQWFSDLALVEHRLRQDIKIYEEQSLTPLQVGMRITNHPTMIVTSRLKSRFASVITMASSYSGQVEQTIYFPLDKIEDLAFQSEHNLILVKKFLKSLGQYGLGDFGPLWLDINAEKIIEFLNDFKIDEIARNISLPLIIEYIKHQVETGELSRWTVAVRGRKTTSPELGEVDWGIPGIKIKQISRTRKRLIQSLGVITNPGDETIGLNDDEIAEAKNIAEMDEKKIALNRAARKVRSPENGLLILYPISKFSTPTTNEGTSRIPLYDDPNNPLARNLIGMAISFPESNNPQPELEYVQGSVPWSDE